MTAPTASQEPRVNLAAEEAVLGAMMVTASAVDAAIADVGLVADDFYRQRHRLIFSACRRLYEAGDPIDALSVTEALRERGELEEAGGADGVAHLASAVPVPGNAAHYAEIVRKNARLRQAMAVLGEAQQHIRSNELDARDAVAELEQAAYRMLADARDGDSRLLEDVLADELDLLDARQRGEKEQGAEPPWRELRSMLPVFKPGQLVICAARPGEGKSTFALNLAEHVARVQELGVAFFSLEMNEEEVAEKLLAARARIDSMRLKGKLSERELTRVVRKSQELSRLALMINTSSYQDLAGIRTEAQRFGARLAARGKQLGLVVVDYLQLLVPPPQERNSNRTQQVSALSRGLKILAGQLGVPVLACSQLNREIDRHERKPVLADLRDSGSIEADANVVIFLHGKTKAIVGDDDADDVWSRQRRGDDTPDADDEAARSVIVAKNRGGPKGEVKLRFDEAHSLWISMANEHEAPAAGSAADASPAPLTQLHDD